MHIHLAQASYIIQRKFQKIQRKISKVRILKISAVKLIHKLFNGICLHSWGPDASFVELSQKPRIPDIQPVIGKLSDFTWMEISQPAVRNFSFIQPCGISLHFTCEVATLYTSSPDLLLHCHHLAGFKFRVTLKLNCELYICVYYCIYFTIFREIADIVNNIGN